MTYRLLSLVALVSLVVPVAELQGQVRDRGWAGCVWKTAPQTASAWLKGKPPTWQDNMETTSELLGFRMIALCDTAPVDLNKPNRLPNWKSLRTVLIQSRPKHVNQAVHSEVKVLLCESFAVKTNERHLYRADVYRQSQAGRTLVYRQFFGSTSGALHAVDKRGRPVTFQLAGAPSATARIRMPQDLFTSPAQDFTSEETCREIASDGSLIDA